MNKANLKSYAPKARLDFIKAMTERANVLGISATGAVPAEVRGDVAIIDGREWPAKVAGQREELLSRIKRHGFEQTMDEVAYTWFNRFAALRYMEIHDYLDHGWRVLSSRDGGLPEILRHASEVSLPGLNADRAREMQLAGNQDNELYKLLLVAQCNELSRVMPFLFERIDDDTELLLPENLLRTDSIVAKLVESVPEEDWQEIEVIGWLYQFYISEKKDQVIGKVVKSEDIPAATQLFTPNWIVQYLVQNSVGRLWLTANPISTLASQWPYYIQPAEQTPEVQAQLDALIQTRVREDGETLNPETITVLDPACGSGHILVVAYDVLKAIYLERGYQPRTIPRLILEKNLYGLDIDDRAAQLAAFALLMKARADDRRLFNDPPKLNILTLQDSVGLDLVELSVHLAPHGLQRADLARLIDTFEHTKTLGALIQISSALKDALAAMTSGLQIALRDGDLYAQQAARDLLPLVWQALVLGAQFDAVVANPPYIGGKYHNPVLAKYLRDKYEGFEKDTFAAFLSRGIGLTKQRGFLGFMTPQVWMFLSSYEKLRIQLLNDETISTLVHPEYNAFWDSAHVAICAFTLHRAKVADYVGSFIRLADFYGADLQPIKTLEAIRNPSCGWLYKTRADSFKDIPGFPIAFWASEKAISVFAKSSTVSSSCSTRKGMATGLNAEFVRYWYEVEFDKIGFNKSRADASISGRKWFPYANGGVYRKWFGNYEEVVNWEGDGRRLQTEMHETGRLRAVNLNLEYIFKEGLSWSSITSDQFSIRYLPKGFLFSSASNALFSSSDQALGFYLAMLNSKVHALLAKFLNPTVNANPGDIGKVPVQGVGSKVGELAEHLISFSRQDWDSYERSWEFQGSPIFWHGARQESSIEDSYLGWTSSCRLAVGEMRALEEESNRLLIDGYGLSNELTSEVPIEQITLTINPSYRYGDGLTDAERWVRFRNDSMRELISYAIGCLMGRYSLDEPGLIYAKAGNFGFDANRYSRFAVDPDGIVPVTDERWFEDDAASRVREFVLAAWGTEALETNMAWLVQGLGTKGGETPDETIRRYLADKFFKDHLQTYKKRPIYWLFSSGKQGAFQALVYLHRYNEGTLARMRAEYVVPLIAKMVSRLEMLNQDVAAASSAAARTKLQKQIEALRKKQLELLAYDEKLRHYADMRITLDLDDGVKVNYAKFGDLVAESKAITGGGDE